MEINLSLQSFVRPRRSLPFFSHVPPHPRVGRSPHSEDVGQICGSTGLCHPNYGFISPTSQRWCSYFTSNSRFIVNEVSYSHLDISSLLPGIGLMRQLSIHRGIVIEVISNGLSVHGDSIIHYPAIRSGRHLLPRFNNSFLKTRHTKESDCVVFTASLLAQLNKRSYTNTDWWQRLEGMREGPRPEMMDQFKCHQLWRHIPFKWHWSQGIVGLNKIF